MILKTAKTKVLVEKIGNRYYMKCKENLVVDITGKIYETNQYIQNFFKSKHINFVEFNILITIAQEEYMQRIVDLCLVYGTFSFPMEIWKINIDNWNDYNDEFWEFLWNLVKKNDGGEK